MLTASFKMQARSYLRCCVTQMAGPVDPCELGGGQYSLQLRSQIFSSKIAFQCKCHDNGPPCKHCQQSFIFLWKPADCLHRFQRLKICRRNTSFCNELKATSISFVRCWWSTAEWSNGWRRVLKLLLARYMAGSRHTDLGCLIVILAAAVASGLPYELYSLSCWSEIPTVSYNDKSALMSKSNSLIVDHKIIGFPLTHSMSFALDMSHLASHHLLYAELVLKTKSRAKANDVRLKICMKLQLVGYRKMIKAEKRINVASNLFDLYNLSLPNAVPLFLSLETLFFCVWGLKLCSGLQTSVQRYTQTRFAIVMPCSAR